MPKARDLSNIVSQNGILADGTIQYSEITGAPPVLKCSSIVYPGDDLAADPVGGQTITINGTGFEATPTVYVSGVLASSVTFVSSTQIRFVSPARAAGTYDIYVVNPGGATAIFVMGISYSGTPTWTTAAGSLGSVAENFSIQLQATSNSTVSYSLAAGSSLPSGVTLSSSGLLTGTVSTEQTFSFSVVATDLENQDTQRSFQVTVALGDPFFRFNTLLITGNGTNASNNNTFLDSSANNFTVTRNGNTSQGTFTPYGSNWSNYFDGSSHLSMPTNTAFSLGTGAFTVEAWAYIPTGNGGANRIVGLGVGASGSAPHYTAWALQTTTISSLYPTAEVSWYRFDGNETVYTTNGGAFIVGKWNHLVVTRNSSNNLAIFVNGTRALSTTSSVNYNAVNSDDLFIGRTTSGGGTPNLTTGYISNVRVVKGTAVYDPTQTTITVPTAPLTAITNTSLLTCQSNRFRDNSSNNFTITANGSPSVQRSSPFNPTDAYSAATIGGSAYFDGTGDYLGVNAGAALQLNDVDFTIEGWVYISGSQTSQGMINCNPHATIGISLNRTGLGDTHVFIGNGSNWLAVPTINSNNSGNNLRFNSWNHVALVRNGSNLVLYHNGTSAGTTTVLPSGMNGTAYIGCVFTGTPSEFLIGNLSNFRIVKGVAVYTGAFTPPTAAISLSGAASAAAYPSTTNVNTTFSASNTSLLLNFTNGGIIDNAMINNLETVGAAQINTSIVKYGSGSVFLGSSNGWLQSPSKDTLNFGSSNFTVELFAYIPAAAVGKAMRWIYSNVSGGASVDFGINNDYIGNSSTLFIVAGAGTSFTATYSGSIVDKWIHLAVVRNGTTIRLYIDGVSIGQATNAGIQGTSNIVNTYIGGDSALPAQGYSVFHGYMDDIRISRGVARYTANFTPPTSAHKIR